MINLSFMNKAVETADGNEFRLLYVIANTMSLKKEGHTKIYRDMLADKLNLSTKQISRLTNSLVEKGLLKKDLVSENGKTVCYYSLNLDKNKKETAMNLDKNVPLNKREKEIIKEIKGNKMEKDIIKENILDDIKTNIFNMKDFMKTVDETFVGKNEDELLDKRIDISRGLDKKRAVLGTDYNRCVSYLNRKYSEAVASM